MNRLEYYIVIVMFSLFFLSGCSNIDVSKCDSLKNENNQIQCKLSMLKNNPSPDICMTIKDNNEQGECLIKLAMIKSDEGVCEKVQDNKLKNVCFSKISQLKQIPALCNKMVSPTDFDKKLCEDYSSCVEKEYDKNASTKDPFICFEDWMVRNKEVSECLTFETNFGKDECYKEFAEFKNDPTLCTNIKRELERESCITNIATQTQNPQICEYKSSDNRENCISHIARLIENVSLCEELSDSDKQDSCLWPIATITKQSAICQQIINSTKKDTCINNIK